MSVSRWLRRQQLEDAGGDRERVGVGLDRDGHVAVGQRHDELSIGRGWVGQRIST